MSKLKYIMFSILIFGCFFGCEKANKVYPDDVGFKANSSAAKTTDILLFEVVPSSESSSNKDLFYRWDWNGDTIWDTDFSSILKRGHRFLISGEYLVSLQYADGTGNTKVVSETIQIAQGFSSPKPEIIITPSSGNYTQEFTFDASLTKDDEDSLENLLFRWDFQGDGLWDTGFDTITLVTKKFSEAGFYNPKLEVKDPSKLYASISRELIVDKTDSLIQVSFTWSTDQIRVGDTVVFDASSSIYLLDPDRDFKTSWFFPYNLVWSEPSYEKQKAHVFLSAGENKVGCKIIVDYTSLENTGYEKIFAAEENLPPDPCNIAVPE